MIAEMRKVVGFVLVLACLLSVVLLIGTGDPLWLATCAVTGVVANMVWPLRRRNRP
jgi:hypothetical protein